MSTLPPDERAPSADAPPVRIGLCAAPERARWSVWDAATMLLPRNYVDAVQRAGAIALLLTPDAAVAARPDSVLDLVDGLILAGGGDVAPAVYGAVPHPRTSEVDPERDGFELALAARALERDLPLLGICRGMQLLNVLRGGSLTQHLPDEFGHGDHCRSLGSFVGADHDVHLAPDSLAARVAGTTRQATKSHHHQGIERVGAGLVVTGWSALDELPEAIELPECRFALGVQWHPEEDPGSPLIDAFVEAARAYAAAREPAAALV